MSFKCPKCNSSCRTLDARLSEESKSFRRRKQCSKCHYRFTTWETGSNPNTVRIKREKNTVIVEQIKHLVNGNLVKQFVKKRESDKETPEVPFVDDVDYDEEEEY